MFLFSLVLGNEMHAWTDLFNEKLHNWWITGIKMLPNILLAIIFWILFYLLARLLRKLIYSFAHHISKSKAIAGLFSSLINIIILAIGLYIGLNILKLDKIAISLLAGAGIIGLTLAFAFQDLTSNFISGVYIDFNKPFDIGDLIQSNNIIGEVEEIGLRSTTIRTLEGLQMLVPNKNIFQNPITNYSRTTSRQIAVNFPISIQDSMDNIERIIVNAVREVKGVDKSRAIEFYYTDFDEQRLKVSLLFWIRQLQLSDSMTAKHEAISAILKALKDNHIERLK
jgi:small conductance mechanosensitive channel